MSTDLTLHSPAAPSLTEQMEFAKAVTSGGRASSLLPDAYKENPANVLIAVGLGQSMGLSPAESLYRIAVIKGKPSASAELIAANVRKAGHKLRVRVEENPPRATATIIRADDPDEPTTVTRDMEWAKRMGLADEPNYRKQPATMLSYRAITACARLACPEALYGVAYTPEELDEGGPARPARPAPTGRVTAADVLGEQPAAPAEDVHDAEVVEEAAPDPITPSQLKALHASLTDAGLGAKEQRDDALRFYAETIGREVASSKDLTRAEASRVIDALKAITATPADEPEPADTDPWAGEGQ